MFLQPILASFPPCCHHVVFPSPLREFFHSPAACWESSCSRRCCCWQRPPWLSRPFRPAGSVFGSGSRRSRRGRAWERPCRSTPGQCSRSRWTGSSKASREGLWWTHKETWDVCHGGQNKTIGRSLRESLSNVWLINIQYITTQPAQSFILTVYWMLCPSPYE